MSDFKNKVIYQIYPKSFCDTNDKESEYPRNYQKRLPKNL